MNFRPGFQIGRQTIDLAWLSLTLALLGTAAFSATTPIVGDVDSRFKRTVTAIAPASGDEDTEFATIALRELVEIYVAEADLARNEAHDRNAVKLLGWARAVDQFSNQLLLVLDDVAAGYPIEFSLSEEGPVGLNIGGRMILLTHPRADQQRAYEQQVLSEFCSREDCARFTAAKVPPEPIPVSSSRVNPQWSFARDGPVCFSESDALQIQFHSAQNLSQLRSHCTQLFHEIRALSGEMQWQTHHGVDIEWSTMAIQPTPGRPQHLVTLNSEGDSALLSLPVLNASPDLFLEVTNWLRIRLATGSADVLTLDAASFGW